MQKRSVTRQLPIEDWPRIEPIEMEPYGFSIRKFYEIWWEAFTYSSYMKDFRDQLYAK